MVMEVRALVATTDHITASMLRRCLNSVGVSPEEGVNPDDVLARVRRFRFEAVVIDLTVQGGGELLKRLRADASTRNSVLFALADDKVRFAKPSSWDPRSSWKSLSASIALYAASAPPTD